MIKNNIFGQILIVVLVFFLLISSVQMFGWGQGISEVEIDQDNLMAMPLVPKGIETKIQTSADEGKQILEKINGRPMFSDTRTPFVPPEVEDPKGVEGGPDPVSELKVQLTGVVITATESYAMILDNLTNQRETYRVGMPLEGEQGGWTLNSIQSRKVVFLSDDNKTAELELEVFSGQLKAGKASNSRKSGKNKSAKKDGKGKQSDREEKKKNADDIRKKIAERRAQMRAEAAKKNK